MLYAEPKIVSCQMIFIPYQPKPLRTIFRIMKKKWYLEGTLG